MKNYSDKEIVEGILEGKEKFLRIFYHSYAPQLLKFIKAKIGSDEDAEEIHQDVLMAGIEALRDFSGKSKLSTFLFAIASHKVIDFYRKKRIKKIIFSQMPEVEKLVSGLLSPEESLDEVMLKEKIKTAFGNITPLYRKILNLKYVEGYSVIEIARSLSISFKSAESLLFRARKAFISVYSK